jgi:type II secretory pathway pseudopilin PulG
MERKTCEFAFPVKLVVVMVAFLSAVFLANATLSQAASDKKKSTEATKTAVDYTEIRIKQLNSALKITEAQEVLWHNLTQVMRENAKDMDALSKVRAEKTNTMNAVEHIKFHTQVTEAQLEQQKKFTPPFEALYASMSDVQKATIDSIFRTGKYGKHTIR